MKIYDIIVIDDNGKLYRLDNGDWITFNFEVSVLEKEKEE